MHIFDKIYRQAKSSPKRIVLPEGSEPRVIRAAQELTCAKIAQIILLGKSEVILKKAKKNNLNISAVEIVDPQKDEKLEDYINIYWNLRKHKGLTPEKAKELLLHNFVYFAAMMLREERCNAFVAGACYTTSDIARAAFHCIQRDPKYSIASGSFLVKIKDRQYGEDGLFLFADCAIVPTPSAKELADIAVTSADVWVRVTGSRPRLAMLSFSSRGSSSHICVDKVRDACAIVKRKKPDLIIDGELQVDSAVAPSVARIKVPHSPLAGRANILIFPSLDAGNIAYKLMQRLAGARMAGPLIQGLACPCSDLSRGASVQEIVDTIAVTAVLAQ